MKTLKTLTASLLITLSFSAFAADGSKAEKLEMNYALRTYIEAVTQGKIGSLIDVLDQEIRFTTTRGEKIINHNKSQVLNGLKFSENVKQNCVTEFRIVESTPNLSVVKVTLKYANFSKIEYLSLANTTKGWKITSVSTSFI
jgi:hypothetical protein